MIQYIHMLFIDFIASVGKWGEFEATSSRIEGRSEEDANISG